jgi:hypothetical protein
MEFMIGKSSSWERFEGDFLSVASGQGKLSAHGMLWVAASPP